MSMDAPFDRGEVDRASLEATERLRARLSSRPIAPASTPRRSILPWVLAGGLFVFAAGMIANPWFESSVRGNLPFANGKVVADSAQLSALTARLEKMESAVPVNSPVIQTERLARTEAQIETSSDQLAREAARIDKLTSEVAGLSARLEGEQERSEATATAAQAAAQRAESMLTLLLARRAIDSGRPLGALEPPLRRAFEQRYPDAVKAVVTLGAAPVTPATLQRDLAAMKPALSGQPAPGAKVSWWDALTGTISAAVSPAAPGRGAQGPIDMATAALARGDVAAAAGQLRRLPAPRSGALTAWLAAAERWQAGNAGLTTLETAVVMPPPELLKPAA
jgi:hypothetical protein